MTTERLNEFYTLAKLLNYTQAAQRLYITQSSLSRHIREMEKELGVELFLRDSHHVELTGDGLYLLNQCEILQKRASFAKFKLVLPSEQEEGEIRLFLMEQILEDSLWKFLCDYQSQHKKIKMCYSMGGKKTILELFHTTDVAILLKDIAGIFPSGMEPVRISEQEAVLVIPPNHHWEDRQRISLSELKGETLVVPYSGNMGSYAENAALAVRECGGKLVQIPADTTQEALFMVGMGQGVAIVPEHVKFRLYPGSRTVEIADAKCEFPTYAYWNHTKDNPQAKVFFEQLIQCGQLF